MKGEVVMKRMYEKPMAYEEVFKANEYIAACTTGVIQDMYIEIADYEKKMPFTDQTVDKVPVFAGTFTMSTVFLV